MNACREWSDRLTDFALGGVDPSDVRAVEAHLAACAACASAFRQLRARAEAIDAAVHELAEEVQPPQGFRARLFAKVEARPAAAAWRAWRASVLAGVAVSVLLLAIALRPSPEKLWPSSRQPSQQLMTELSTWRSPTESLLRSPGDTLLKSTPRLGHFYFQLEPLRKSPVKGRRGKNDES